MLNQTSVSDSLPCYDIHDSDSVFHVWQEVQAKVAPVLAKWRNKLLAAALEAFQENVAIAADKRQQVQRALRYWNNRALAGAFAQWLQTVEVGHSPTAKQTRFQQTWSRWCKCSMYTMHTCCYVLDQTSISLQIQWLQEMTLCSCIDKVFASWLLCLGHCPWLAIAALIAA